MCFEERHKQQFRLCLVKKHEQQFFVFGAPWSQVRVLPPALPGERSNSRAPLSPKRDRIFLHAPGSCPGCMADIAQAVRAGVQLRILHAGGGSNPPVCLPGKTRQDSFFRFWTVLIFIHAPGGSSFPGCMRESFEQAPAISTTPESGGGTRSPSLPVKRVFAKVKQGGAMLCGGTVMLSFAVDKLGAELQRQSFASLSNAKAKSSRTL